MCMGFFSEYKGLNKLLQQKRSVVFYAENKYYFQYFKRLIIDLLENKVKVHYITSDSSDPLLSSNTPGLQVIYVKWMLGHFFSRISADVMILTMPDLGNFLFKRTSLVGKYIYMFHAAVSTHQQYRKESFFNYDAIFCAGEYQVNEISMAEKLYALNQKDLIPYGYPLIDELTNQKKGNVEPVILVAPSWFEGCIFNVCIKELLIQLSLYHYKVIIRSHPEFEKRRKSDFKLIRKLLKKYPRMLMDDETDVMKTLSGTDILITDRSGIAFEFALGYHKPVLFIDTVLKQANPHWNEIGLDPVENSLRSELGISISPDSLELLPQKISELKIMSIMFPEKMKNLKKKYFFNSDTSYNAGLNYILGNIRIQNT